MSDQVSWQWSGWWQRLGAHRLFWPIAGLALLLFFNLFFDPGFFALETREGNLYGPMITVLRQGVKVMLLATGMTLVIATGGVDLSVGSVMAMAGALVAQLAMLAHWSFPWLLGIALLLAGGVGMVNGLLITRAGLQPIVATLIMMVLGRGVALGITGALPMKIDDSAILYLGRGYVMGLPVPVLLVVVLYAVAAMICRRTAFGLFVEAVGDNAVASHNSGVHTSIVQLSVYIFCALCAALAGLVTIGDIGRMEPDRLGQMLELDAITAVVVGGTTLTGGRFTLTGSLIGAVLIQTLTVTLIRQGMPADVAPVPKALVIISVCLLQSQKLRDQMSGWMARGGRSIP